jgi:excisionase family DNA binding protein
VAELPQGQGRAQREEMFRRLVEALAARLAEEPVSVEVLERATARAAMRERRLELLTPEAVAEWLKVRPSTVRSMARSGVLRGRMVGGVWRFLWADVEAYVLGLGADSDC